MKELVKTTIGETSTKLSFSNLVTYLRILIRYFKFNKDANISSKEKPKNNEEFLSLIAIEEKTAKSDSTKIVDIQIHENHQKRVKELEFIIFEFDEALKKEILERTVLVKQLELEKQDLVEK